MGARGSGVVARFAIVALGACYGRTPLSAFDTPPGPADGGSTVRADARGDVDKQTALDTTSIVRGSGCGKPLPADQPITVPGTPKGYKQYKVMETGRTLAGKDPTRAVPRTFWVRVPADYDRNRAYRVVFLGQGCGASAVANRNTYALFDESRGGTEQAIYVAIDIPANPLNMDCYDIRAELGSSEWEAFELMARVVDDNYCIDKNRLFVAGYGSEGGGGLADMYGCYFAGLPSPPRAFAPGFRIRGMASVVAFHPPNNPPCNGPVAGLWIYDPSCADTVPGRGAPAIRDRVLAANGCVGSRTTSWSPSWSSTSVLPGNCEQYIDCQRDFPVVFCETTLQGCSTQQDAAIPLFTKFFDLMNAPPRP